MRPLLAFVVLGVACSSSSSSDPPRTTPSLARVDRHALLAQRFHGFVPTPETLALEVHGEGIEARVPKHVALTLPAHAKAPMLLRRGDVGLEARWLGVVDVPAELSAKTVAYPGLLPHATMVHVPLSDGTEELLYLDAPGTRELRYALKVHGGGLRLVSNVLEVIAPDGRPSLHVGTPFIIDARGQTRFGALTLTGCAYDDSFAPPHKRPIVPPGNGACTLTARWDDEGLTYPLLVDPAFRSTGSMATRRFDFGLVAYDDSSISSKGLAAMASGGQAGTSILSSVEAFDGAAWTTLKPMTTARAGHGAVAWVSKTLVLVAGGRTGTSTFTESTETYDPKSGWSDQGKLPGGPRQHLGLVTTPSNDAVYAVGGGAPLATAKVDTLKPGGTWSASPGLNVARTDHATIVACPGGTSSACMERILVAGGSSDLRTEVLESGWSFGASLLDPTFSPSIIRADGRIFLLGGKLISPLDKIYSVLETSPLALSYLSTTPLTTGREGPASGTLLDSKGVTRIVVAGGNGTNVSDLVTNPVTPVVTSVTGGAGRFDGRAVNLDKAIVLVAGGRTSSTGTATVTGDELVVLLANGEACSAAAECDSGVCVDGVCCNTACGGQCQACNTKGAVGTCTTVTMSNGPTGYPAGQAVTGFGSTTRTGCAGHGTICGSYCNGSSATACTFAATATECVAPSCTGGIETQSAKCNGSGSCTVPTTKGCGEYACGATACKITCTSLADCTTGYKCDAPSSKCVPNGTKGSPCSTTAPCATGLTCIDGTCCTSSTCGAPNKCNNPEDPGTCKLPKGTACTSGTLCASGLCVDGRCCDTACTGQCEACDVGGAEGTCSAVSGAPHGARSACSGTGDCKAQCNGSIRNACGTPPGSSVTCAPPSCKDGVASLITTCVGTGSCPTPVTETCAPYVCNKDGSACAKSCAAETDCATGYTCKLGKCEVKVGVACTKASDCLSGSCVDGFCCDSPCSGQCEACNLPGFEGRCTPATGAPVGARTKCDDGAGDPCRALQCNGKDPTKCVGYVNGPEKQCKAACDSASSVTTSFCDGAGSCAAGSPVTCGNYVCEGSACRTACTDTTHCAKGFVCNEGKCAPPASKCTEDGKASIPPEGEAVACLGYRCNPSTGNCRVSCVATEDCTTGFACDGGKCVPTAPSGDSGDEGGCSTHAPGAGSHGAWLLLCLAALGLRRRR